MKTKAVLLLAFLLGFTGSASAATVSVPAPTAQGAEPIRYVADPGEVNDPVVSLGDFVNERFERFATVTDPSAELFAGEGCTGVGPHTVTCVVTSIDQVDVSLGDGDDSVTVAPGAASPGVLADGGKGADRLTGGADFDLLDGGPGRDVVDGGELDDVLRDADASADVVTGGGGDDSLSFAGRERRPVRFSAASGTGRTEERDRVTDVETIVGTAGPDSFTGGGAGLSFRGRAGADRFACRSAGDVVLNPRTNDRLSGCRRARLELAGSRYLVFDLRPERAGRRLRFAMGCPRFEGEEGSVSTCPLPFSLRAGGAVVARGRIMSRAAADPRTTVRLTRAGRRLVRRPRGVLVEARVAADSRLYRWRFRIRG